MARKVALINMKGGVGKSTLAANLAWEMATRPWYKRVLVVDIDPQFNCSQYLVGARRFEVYLESNSPTVWDIFEQLTSVPGKPSTPIEPGEAVISIYANYAGGLVNLIPSRLELSQALHNPAHKDRLLKQAIDELEEAYDLVIIDCAPTESMLTTAAYLCADCILIPVRPEFLSTVGLPLLEQSLNNFSGIYPGEAPEVLGLVFNAISGYSPEELTSAAEVRSIARENGWPVFAETVVYSKSFPKGARNGTPIFSTGYARTSVKRNFRNFAREFARDIGL